MHMINTELTMSSLEISRVVGSRHDSVKRTIERLVDKSVIVQPPMVDEQTSDSIGRPRTESVYQMNKRDSFVVVAQLSPEFTAALVDRWQELEQRASRPLTPGEQLLAQAQAVIGIERRQSQQQAALELVEARTAQLEQVRYLDSVPSGFESITTIRDRIGRRHGLPPWVVNYVMRELPDAPLPFAMVRSKHSDNGGQPFAIWPRPAVTRRFDQFVSQSTYVTAERATHPDIPHGRFKIHRSPDA